MNYKNLESKKAEILENLKGDWISVNRDFSLVFTITAHESPTSEALNTVICRKIYNDKTEEEIPMNFFWTNDVLRITYNSKPCVVCFIEGANELGFFNSIMTCNEVEENHLLIMFKKILK